MTTSVAPPSSSAAWEKRPLLEHAFRGPLGAFVFGAAVTAGWTPCIGPILAAILIPAIFLFAFRIYERKENQSEWITMFLLML